MKANMELAREDPKRLGHAFLRVLPQSLFVLLPIFALQLKLVLIFKRRMYMEHLMVGDPQPHLHLHGHTGGGRPGMARRALARRLDQSLVGADGSGDRLDTAEPVPDAKTCVSTALVWGTIAFFTIGTLYLCLVSFTAIGALVASLVSL